METTDLTHHIMSRFNEDLEGLRAGVLQMGGLVEQQLQDGVRALTEGDSRLGEEVARLDYRVNAMEVAIDEDCSRILATRNPTASDLRLIVTVIKTITDLERIGDEAEKLGSISTRLASVERPTDRYR
jgi:phosphate transport system protein